MKIIIYTDPLDEMSIHEMADAHIVLTAQEHGSYFVSKDKHTPECYMGCTFTKTAVKGLLGRVISEPS